MPLYGASLVAVHMGLGGPTGGRTGGVPFFMYFGLWDSPETSIRYEREHHMAKQYWLQREGKTYGPYSGGKLKKLAGEGKIGPGDLISADKQAWLLAEMVRGLSLRTTVTPPQTASVASDLSSHEVLPETGTTSRTRHRRTSSSSHEDRLQPRSSRTKWAVIVVIGVAAVGLAVAIAVWLWTPSGGPMTSEELAQSNENSQHEGRSHGKPDVMRTAPSPTTRRAGPPPHRSENAKKTTGRSKLAASVDSAPTRALQEKKREQEVAAREDARRAAIWTDIKKRGQDVAFRRFVEAVSHIIRNANSFEQKTTMIAGPVRLDAGTAPIPAVGGDIEAKCRALRDLIDSTAKHGQEWVHAFADASRANNHLAASYAKRRMDAAERGVRTGMSRIAALRDDLQSIIQD